MRPGASLAILLTASTGCAMTVLDTAVVLPTIARDLGASFAEVAWVVSSSVLCFAALLLPAGSIADRFGRRKVFLGGAGLFALASLLCGAAPSTPGLYLARGALGVGAAFLLAPALAIIGHTFHYEAERVRAWAIWGGIMGITMVLAPIVGGVIAYGLDGFAVDQEDRSVSKPFVSAASVRAAPLVFDATRTRDATAEDTEREKSCSA